MSTYYYLISGLPELSLEDGKLSNTVGSFKREIYAELSIYDKKMIDLFFLKYDNENLLLLLKDKDSLIDPRGNFSAEELITIISGAKEDAIAMDEKYPAYFYHFLSDYYSSDQDVFFKAEDSLTVYYYDYGMKCPNGFIASWFEFNLNVNNILLAISLRKYKQDVNPYVVGTTDVCEALSRSNARDFGLGRELDYFEQLMRISQIDDLVEREKKTDLLKWDWMETASCFNYFTIERIFVHLLRLEMIERWTYLDKEKGYEMFQLIIKTLKDEVRIPEEFISPNTER